LIDLFIHLLAEIEHNTENTIVIAK